MGIDDLSGTRLNRASEMPRVFLKSESDFSRWRRAGRVP
jgi:hypothetical protein